MREIRILLWITRRLAARYGRDFTLDGKLVGDIGEVLAAEKYGLQLLPPNNHIHDAIETASGRNVQIKSSFNDRSYFPCDHIPDYFLAIRILEDGTIEELFNGPGIFVYEEYIINRGLQANGRYLYNLQGNILRQLNLDVPNVNKISQVHIEH
jgi:hypothetical protein